MRKLVIIGARALGREVCNYAKDIGMDVKGFLDSDKNALAGFVGYPSVLSSVEDYYVASDDVFVCALGDSRCRAKYVKVIEEKGGCFVSIIHKHAYIGHNVKIGIGCIVAPNVTITADVSIGNHVLINVNSSINHDSVIGDYVSISPGCRLTGRNRVQPCIKLSPNTVLVPDECID